MKMRLPAMAIAANLMLGLCATVAADELPAPSELKFDEMFRLPVGSRGLDPSEKLLRLDGRRVRIVGYRVAQEDVHGFLLAPLPLALGDEDESLADDLPATVVFVEVPDGVAAPPAAAGPLRLTGTLDLGSRAEADGRVSFVRLRLDEPIARLYR